MKIGILFGAALAFAPAIALADNQAGQNQPPSSQTQDQTQGQTQGQTQDVTTQRLLPKDAKLVGTVESADVRAFPEQMAKTGQKPANIEKEGVVGVGGIDRVWTTKTAYKRTVTQLDQKLKGEGIEPIAKTTTQSSTAWNVRMPDGHIANLVVRNTQPTTIESVQAAAMMGTVTEQPGQNNQQQQQQQQAAPSSKTKSNPNPNGTYNKP